MASIYDKRILSGSDLEKIEELNRQWQQTADSEKRRQLHDRAESIRAQYGYSGGAAGDEFIVTGAQLLNNAEAQSDYIGALEKMRDAEQQAYADQVAAIQSDGEKRLREAYIKNMQDSLGIGQRLRDAGLSGGATESTVAYMNNIYNTARNDIISDTLDNKNEAEKKATDARMQAELDIAKAQREGAAERAELIAAAEKEAYERERDKAEYDYRKLVDDREFEWKKLTDERDFSYKKEQDKLAAEKAAKAAEAAQKAAKSTVYKQASSANPANLTVSNVITLIKAGAYDEKFAPILGISDEEVRAMAKNYSEADKRSAAWELLENGIYDDSFPDLLGYTEDVLLRYVNSFFAGR